MAKKRTPPAKDDYLSSLTQNQREALRRLQELVDKSDKTLKDYSQMGVELERLKPEGTGYGQNWIDKVNQHLQDQGVRSNRTLLYRALKLRKLYQTREQVDSLEGLYWDHVMLLLNIKDDAKREEIQKLAREHQWSTRDLHKEIHKRIGYGPARGRRTPRFKSHGPEVDLRNLKKQISTWLSWDEAVWSAEGGTLTQLRKLKPGQLTQGVLEELGQAEKQLGELARRAEALRAELMGQLRRLNNPNG